MMTMEMNKDGASHKHLNFYRAKSLTAFSTSPYKGAYLWAGGLARKTHLLWLARGGDPEVIFPRYP